MSKQLTCTYIPQSNLKQQKYAKTFANNMIKKAISQLQNSYWSVTFNHSHRNTQYNSIYTQVIDLTLQISTNFLACGKAIRSAVDLADILMNNFVLGVKIKNISMVGGFVYVAIKYLSEGLNTVITHLNKIKNIAHQSSFNQNSEEFILACQNLNTLILPNLFPESLTLIKIQNLILNALICLSRAIQNHEIRLININQKQIDHQELFYHKSLKAVKVCKLSQKNYLYKELLASYFKYVSQKRVVPHLDICKLLIDAFSMEQQPTKNNESSNSKIFSRNDEDIMGFLIRKCFILILQHSNNKSFFVDDYVLSETVKICLSTSPYKEHSKNIGQIFHTLLCKNKLQLVVDTQTWMRINLENKKQKGQGLIETFEYISSVLYFLNEVTIPQFNQSVIKKNKSQSKVIKQTRQLSKSLNKYINYLVQQNQPVLINILEQIINVLYRINVHLFSLSQKKDINDDKIIQDWSVCSQLQNIIITNSAFKSIRGHYYSTYQFLNIFILITKQYILVNQINNQNHPISHRLALGYKATNQKLLSYMQIFKNIDSIRKNQQLLDKIFRYWDQLINFGASFLENCNNVYNLQKIADIIKQLLKCEPMIALSHNLGPKNNKNTQKQVINNKINKVYGIYNLLIVLHKLKQTKVQQQTDTNDNIGIQTKSHDGLSLTKSSLMILKREKQRIRTNLMTFISSYLIDYVLTNIIPSIRQYYNDKNRTESYPFQDIFAHFLTIIPQLYSNLTLEQRVSICKTRKRIVESINQRTLEKCRYVYHRNVASLLQDYFYFHVNNSKTMTKIKQDQKIEMKSNIISFLDSYIYLYRNEQSFRTSLSERKSVSKKSTKKNQIRQQQKTVAKSKSVHSQNITSYHKDYHDMIFIDFVQWVTNYVKTKEIDDILAYIDEMMEEWLQGLTLEQYLINLTKQIKSRNNATSMDFQLMTQCTNKLLYIQTNNRRQWRRQVECKNKQQPEDGQNEIKISIQFEVQQASVHIGQLNEIICNYGTFCQQYFKYQEQNINNLIKNNWGKQYLQGNKTKYKILCQFENINRVSVCLNNIIGVFHTIGHSYSTNTNKLNNIFQFLCNLKLMICSQYQSVLQMYTRYAQMVFLDYLPLFQHKYQEITQFIHQRHQKYQQNSFQHQYLIPIIKLYLGFYTNGYNGQIPKIISQNNTLKQIYVIKNLKHMHPHKSLLRSISAHIFNLRQLNQASILKYQQPILPITYSILNHGSQQKQNKSKTKIQVRNILENCSNQIQHHIFISILWNILECFILHQQISEFRSILRLAMLYFVKSRNFRGILLTLQCHQMKIKHLPIHNANNINQSHRKSQIQSISSKNNAGKANELSSALDMLSISDSLSNILKTIFTSNFDKRDYDKFCKIVLGVGNKRRTSISFNVSFHSIMQLLVNSLSMCGLVGAQVFLLLGDHACKALQCRKQSIMYQYYLQLCKQSQQKQQKKNKRNIDRNLITIYKNTQQQKEQLHKLEMYLIQKIKQIIPHSYYHALMIENLLHTIKYDNHHNGSLDDKKIDEQTLVDLCVLMMDHNYQYKSMVQDMHQLTITINQTDEVQYINLIDMSNSKYEKFLSNYSANHTSKISYLLSKKFQYPLTIIYPFGPKVYIIGVQNPIIVLQLDRFQFDEHIHTVDNLILNNSRLLNDKNIDPKEWWKSRDRVDRSIGKIVNQIGVVLWDICFNSDHMKFISNTERKLWKLIYICLKSAIKDVKKINTIISCSGINTSGISVQQLILNVNSFINTQICHKSRTIGEQNLLLFIHPHYSIFPYQQNSYLSKERAVYRLPSIKYILQQRKKQINYKIFNIANTKYLVNSGNDLPETEKNFYKIKNNFPLWKGIVGRKPSIAQYLSLFQSQAFLFMGHGAGNAHIREKQFYNKIINCLILLFGCSSASMCQQKSQPNGISHSHLINGAPGLLGCLWEVTDKDTDKVTQSLFVGLGKQAQNLSRLLSSSKKRCKHQYLNGGSIVIFGLPIYVYSD